MNAVKKAKVHLQLRESAIEDSSLVSSREGRLRNPDCEPGWRGAFSFPGGSRGISQHLCGTQVAASLPTRVVDWTSVAGDVIVGGKRVCFRSMGIGTGCRVVANPEWGGCWSLRTPSWTSISDWRGNWTTAVAGGLVFSHDFSSRFRVGNSTVEHKYEPVGVSFVLVTWDDGALLHVE